jgi:hypothetical protein
VGVGLGWVLSIYNDSSPPQKIALGERKLSSKCHKITSHAIRQWYEWIILWFHQVKSIYCKRDLYGFRLFPKKLEVGQNYNSHKKYEGGGGCETGDEHVTF